MRVKITVYYGDNGKAISRMSSPLLLAPREDDPDTFDEAVDYLHEHVIEPFSLDGYDLVDDEEEEDAVGVDYLAAWVIEEYFEDKDTAVEVLTEILDEVDSVLGEIE